MAEETIVAKDGLVIAMDTTKEKIKHYLEEAGKTLEIAADSQASHKLAVLRFILDMLDIQDKPTRAAAYRQWDATPSSFGTNASALRQAIWGQKTAIQAKIDRVIEV